VKIWAKCEEIWAKNVQIFAILLYVRLIYKKMAPKMKVKSFFFLEVMF